MNYCNKCGTKLEERTAGVEWYCPSCPRHVYANPIPTVDAIFFDEAGRILLGVRSKQPNKGKLNLPGGFVDPDETFEEGLTRELREELQLEPSDYSPFIYAGSRVDSHEQEGTVRGLLPVMMISKMSHREFEPNDEVSEYHWKLPSELGPDDVSNHSEYEHIMRANELYLRLNP